MTTIPRVKDLGIFRIFGQPNLLIQVDREACARYGVRVSDVNSMVQAAIGGQAVTQVMEGEKCFDLVVRFLPQYRQDAETISEIQVNTPDGTLIPLKQLAAIVKDNGAFVIYRENNDRYIPIKFSVRERDLAGIVKDAQSSAWLNTSLFLNAITSNGRANMLSSRMKSPVENHCSPEPAHHSLFALFHV